MMNNTNNGDRYPIPSRGVFSNIEDNRQVQTQRQRLFGDFLDQHGHHDFEEQQQHNERRARHDQQQQFFRVAQQMQPPPPAQPQRREFIRPDDDNNLAAATLLGFHRQQPQQQQQQQPVERPDALALRTTRIARCNPSNSTVTTTKKSKKQFPNRQVGTGFIPRGGGGGGGSSNPNTVPIRNRQHVPQNGSSTAPTSQPPPRHEADEIIRSALTTTAESCVITKAAGKTKKLLFDENAITTKDVKAAGKFLLEYLSNQADDTVLELVNKRGILCGTCKLKVSTKENSVNAVELAKGLQTYYQDRQPGIPLDPYTIDAIQRIIDITIPPPTITNKLKIELNNQVDFQWYLDQHNNNMNYEQQPPQPPGPPRGEKIPDSGFSSDSDSDSDSENTESESE